MKTRFFMMSAAAAIVIGPLLLFQNCASPMPEMASNEATSIGGCSPTQQDYLGTCVENNLSCSIANGAGTQLFDPVAGNYGACQASICNTNYHVEAGVCAANSRACTIAGGNGTQSWNGTAYGACVANTCNAGNHIENGVCLPDVKACAIANGAGEQTWNGTTYGACVAKSCNATFHLANNLCNGPINAIYRAFQGGNGHYWNTAPVAPGGFVVEGESFKLYATAPANSVLLRTCRTVLGGRIPIAGTYTVRSGGCVGNDIAGPILGYAPVVQFPGSVPLYSCTTVGTNNRYMTTKSIAECNQGLPVSILGFVFN